VEKTLETNRKFNAKSLVGEDPSYEGRLKYWTNELCTTRPRTFDFVVTVRLSGQGYITALTWRSLEVTARFSTPAGFSNVSYRPYSLSP